MPCVALTELLDQLLVLAPPLFRSALLYDLGEIHRRSLWRVVEGHREREAGQQKKGCYEVAYLHVHGIVPVGGAAESVKGVVLVDKAAYRVPVRVREYFRPKNDL